MKPDTNRPVALEDLLRLKRAERPPAEFWTQFDRELRAKQLAALMAPRPWWHRVPNVWPIFIRHRVLLGASAVLALTAVSLRSTRTSPAVEDHAFALANPAVDSARGDFVGAPQPTEFDVVIAERTVNFPRYEQIAVSELSSPAEPSAGSPDLSIAFTPVLASVGFSAAGAEIEALREPVRFVTATTMSLATPEKLSPRKVAVGSGFEARLLPARAAVEPLQQMTSPGERSRARLLSAMVSMTSMETSARTTERVANRIDEERLYEQVNRFGARGDRLNVKF